MEYNEIKENIVKLEMIMQEVKEGLEQLNPESETQPENAYPDVLLNLKHDLIEIWDKQDTNRRVSLKRVYDRIGHDEFVQKYNNNDFILIDKNTKEIHEDNENNAEKTISNLYERITAITGSNTDFTGLTYTNTQIEGEVSGNGHKAVVKSIMVGGYHIQKLHIRFFVKEL